MANVSLPGVVNQLERRFKQQGSGSTRFAQDVVDAINTAIRKINRGANLATRLSATTGVEGTISGLDSDYTDVLVDVATVVLIDQGQRPSKGFEDSVNRLRVGVDFMIDQIRSDLLNQVMDADTDNETQVVGVTLDDD